MDVVPQLLSAPAWPQSRECVIEPSSPAMGRLLSKKRFSRQQWLKKSIERESSIQKMRPYDSIGACQRNAADFFNSIDKQRRSSSAPAFSGLTPTADMSTSARFRRHGVNAVEKRVFEDLSQHWL